MLGLKMFLSLDLLALHCSFYYNFTIKWQWSNPFIIELNASCWSTAQLLNVYRRTGWLQFLSPPLPQLSQPTYSHPSNDPLGCEASPHLTAHASLWQSAPSTMAFLLSLFPPASEALRESAHPFMSAILALSWRLHSGVSENSVE